MAEKRLVREPGSVHPRRGRMERGEDAREDGEDNNDRHRIRGRRGRPALMSEFGDLNRGVLFVGVESAAIALDVASRVLRGAIDRAFDEDYSSPGDIVRGLTGEADRAIYDLVDEMRAVPRRLSTRFEEAMRSPRADQGERRRRDSAGATTPADSPNGKP
ncbi:MAG: hypothetical protein RMJ98_12600 [Myxococcales bacterium]|nr:hypothetical protein [Polyangiaceae bacterium]MDW8250126.1 hypothetical protein [Myxococcales bacterium]